MLPPPKGFKRCPVKDCGKVATEGHHVLYDYHRGGPVVFDLCAEHHSWITRAQSHAGRRQHYPLTEKQRWFFWYRLINGELKRPRNTHLDREWSEREALPMAISEQPVQETEVEVGMKAAKGTRKEPRSTGMARLKRKRQAKRPHRRRGRRTS